MDGIVPYVNYLLLAGFWMGAALLFTRGGRLGLVRQRMQTIAGQAQIAAKDSTLAKTARELLAGPRWDAMQRDLAESLSYIKNLVVIGRGETMSAQLLLEELSELSQTLGPAFLTMARDIQLSDKEAAAGELYKVMPESIARDVGEFLAGWEDIPPSDLLGTVEVYRSSLREARVTRQKRRDEMISDLVYFPVVVNAMAVLMNFIYIAYFLQQKDALGLLFGQ